MEKVESININFEVGVEVEDKEASITVPGELRLTPGVIQYIVEALGQRELTLKHMNISEDHQKELSGVPNVVLKEEASE